MINAVGVIEDLQGEERFCAEVESFVKDINPHVQVIFSDSPERL